MTQSLHRGVTGTAAPARRRGLRSVSRVTELRAGLEGQHRSGRRRWEGQLARRMFLTDAAALVVAVVTAHAVRIGSFDSAVGAVHGMSYTVIGVLLVATWLVATVAFRTRDHKVLGSGAEEYQRLARATFVVFGWVAIVSLITSYDASRLYLAITFPLGLVLLFLERKAWRVWLHGRRGDGRYVARVLVIGGVRSARTMTSRFAHDVGVGLSVAGVWVPDRAALPGEEIHVGSDAFPVLGTETDLDDALRLGEIDTVVVTDTEHLGHEGMRELAWRLEGRDIDLLVAPNVLDVAGPRIHVDAHGNMPLIYLSEPRYSAASNLPKAAFDRTFAAAVLLAASPVLLAAVLAVRLTSRGPVFYRSERIGAHGVPFQMLKLRTMIDGADRVRAALEAANEGAGPLFKMRDDPRVTRVGRFLRRFSIDELPQFINVLRGDMSIVGPRPPLREEVDVYDDTVRRRLLVKQGVTGLWQVSGRSDLSWEDSVRLDLDYVENWSMLRDLHIVARTAKAVLASRGAY